MKEIRPAILMLVLFTVICGGIYPAVVTGVAHAIFPKQANGSMVTSASSARGGRAVRGSGSPFARGLSRLTAEAYVRKTGRGEASG